MRTLKMRILAMALTATTFCAGEALAQRAPGSPFSITVTRSKTDSGRKTNFNDGYASSRDYNRAVTLKVVIRNMTTNEVDTKVEGLFVADAMSSGAVDGIYCKDVQNEKIPSRGVKEFTIESERLQGHEYKGYYSSYKYGSKFKGYIVRVFANNQIAEVNASQPSLQKIGWDEKLIKKMSPDTGSDEQPARAADEGAGHRGRPVEQPAIVPEKKGGSTSF